MKGTIAVMMFVLSTGCTDEPQPVPPPPVPTPEMCPQGFGPLEDLPGCYLDVAIKTGWIRAEESCERFLADNVTAHLVVIDREVEHKKFSAIALDGDLWIGRLQAAEDDAFRNINYIEYGPTHWSPGEPNDSAGGIPGNGDERCIEYRFETGLWNDEKCASPDRVFCEWDNVDPYSWRPGGNS